MVQQIHARRNQATEWSFASQQKIDDPFNSLELDVVFSTPDGGEMIVPAFWAGGSEWRVRFAAPAIGAYQWRTVCSNDSCDLHGIEGVLTVSEYDGDNPLLRHGPLRVNEDRRHLEHADGTPFLWLADTWWMGLCKRLTWPDEFQMLTADRVSKNFSVIQIVAGLYPDMPSFDERGANEAGFPWERDYTTINPAYFDNADLRIQWLVRSGLVPCILGCWGYYLPLLGLQKMRRHWRYLVARYSAYPVVWCLAGEATMPYYLTENRERDVELQRNGWTDLAAYLREIDPYHHPVTIHPTSVGRDQVNDDSLLDIDMLQTGHGGYESIPNTIDLMRASLIREPCMPVINGEVCYEGILEGSREEIQRFMFWSCMLSGAAGHTYGANGIWQVNTIDEPYGPSPWGAAWGNRPWDEAANLPGSNQVGIGKALLERFDWWRFEPHQEWVEPSAQGEEYMSAYAAGIPGEVRVIYFFRPLFPWGNIPQISNLERDITYTAHWVDPKSGEEFPIGFVRPDEGIWKVPLPPVAQDWLLILRRAPAEVPEPGATMFA